MYSKSLVFAQFFLIGIMAVSSQGILSSWPGLSILAVGVLFGLWTINYNKLGNFNIRPELKDGCALVTTGPYRLVRHPMYTSVLLMTLGMVVSTPNYLEISSFVLLMMVLALKAVREERLWCVENAAYRDYMKETKRFIPFLY